MTTLAQPPKPCPPPRRRRWPLIAGDFRVSQHAQDRIAEMGVSLDDVERVLRDFQNRYEQNYFGKTSGPTVPRANQKRVMYQRGRLAVATSELPGQDKVVVSVLWNVRQPYKRGEKS